MATVLLALGSNVGDRSEYLRAAVSRLDSRGFTVQRRSRDYVTPSIGGPAHQEDFLNAAVVAETRLSPRATLAALQQIESELGRNRSIRWAPRTIDLDLLLYEDRIVDEPDLKVPHPRMALRRFVLEPAAEIAGHLVHPRLRRDIAALYRHLDAAPDHAVMLTADTTAIAIVNQVIATSGPELVGAYSESPFHEAPPDSHPGWSLRLVSGEDATTLLHRYGVTHGSPRTSGTGEGPPKVLMILVNDGDFTAAAWHARIRRQLERGAPCPWLEVNSGRPDEAADEIAACLQSMRRIPRQAAE